MSRQTSIEAYHMISSSGLLSTMRKKVCKAIAYNAPCTSGEAFKWMLDNGEYSNPLSQSRARVTELRDLGVVREIGTRPCNVSGHNAIVWELTGDLPSGKVLKGSKKRDIRLCSNCHTWWERGDTGCNCGLWRKDLQGQL